MAWYVFHACVSFWSGHLSGVVLSDDFGPGAEFIGVVAALRGDVIRISTGSGDAAAGPVSSGTKIFLGDEIEVASGGRMQIMLLDETVFTLGSGAKLVIDEFVYDPAAESGSMTTQITRRSFAFSASLPNQARKAAKPSSFPPPASASAARRWLALLVRTAPARLCWSVPDLTALAPPLAPLQCLNALGSVDLTRPNFSTSIIPDQPPATPELAAPETIQTIEQSTGEDAETEIASALGVESLDVVPVTDTDGDGIPDQVGGSEAPGDSIAIAATGSGVTSDASILDAAFAAMTAGAPEGEDLGDIDTAGINLGAGAAAVFSGGAQFLGDTSLDQLRNIGLTAPPTYAATGVSIACSNSSAADAAAAMT